MLDWTGLDSVRSRTAHNELYALRVYVKQFVISLPAMSLGDWFSVSRKGGTGEVGWYIHPKGENSRAVCGFGCIRILQ